MELKYRPNDYVPIKESIIYSFQQIVLLAASVVVMPVTVATALGLDRADITSLLQRTFILCGVMMILQVKFGHGFPIQHGPAGLWSATYIAMATIMPGLGVPLDELRPSIEAAMIGGGSMVMILALLGLMKYIARFFTPVINGLTIMLMVIQLSSSILKGMLGISASSQVIELKALGASLFTLAIILIINYRCSGFVRSIATFIGVVIGWIFAVIIGVADVPYLMTYGLFDFPKPLAWGTPVFNPGIVATGIVGSLILLSMSFASVNGMADTIGEKMSEKKIKNTVFFHGMAVSLTGVFASIGFMPYVSAIGIVQMTGVAAKRPMYLASIWMIILGFITPLGALLASIPPSVGNGALIVVFGLCMGQALAEFKKVEFTSRENMIVGLSSIVGIGVMFLPSGIFSEMPIVASCLMSNGLIVGIVMAFLLEHIILRKEPN